MSRKLVLCVLVLGLAGATVTVASAQMGHKAMQAAREAPIPRSDRPERMADNEIGPAQPGGRGIAAQGLPQPVGHEDGPSAVDSEESISAAPSDGYEREGSHSEKVATTPDTRAAGTYAGVEPGGARLPAVPVAVGKTPLAITWPGFQMRPDGTSRVFIQSTSALEAETAQVDGKFTMRFPGARVAGATNRLPLETRFFNTPVTKVSLAVNKDGVTLVLEMRAPVTPRVSSERGPSGFFFTYLDLPAGKFVENAPVVPASAGASGGAVSASAPEPSDHLTTLDGNADLKSKSAAKIKVGASASMDDELPPGIKATSKTQPAKSGSGGSASGGIKLGK